MARHPRLLPLLFLAVVVTAAAPACAIFHFGFSSDLDNPYNGFSRHEMWRRAALASKARVLTHTARLGQALGKPTVAPGDISGADVTATPYTHLGHWLTVGVGTPPQPSKLIVDTGSDLTWTQCKPLNPNITTQVEPLYDPGKSSSFSILPCSSKHCKEGLFSNKKCTDNKCVYESYYSTNVTASGFLATETFTFGTHHSVAVPLAFGCGKFSVGTIAGASGILGISPSSMSLISQLSIPKFSYCLTPFADRKPSPLNFGATADLGKYKTSGPVQTTSLLKNPVEDIFYYVPMVGISLGPKLLDVPAASLALQPKGTGGTVVDMATTLGYLVEPAFRELRKAVLETVKLPVANRTVEEFQLCFDLPHGMAMEKVAVPPLRLHFDGGAEMVLPRENYFQEPAPGLMCLAVVQTPDAFTPSIIGNVLQQNMHVLLDVRDRKFSFAPAQCDKI